MKPKSLSSIVLCTALCAFSFTVIGDESVKAPKPPKPPKPAKVKFHLFSQTSMMNEGVIAGAGARVDLHINGQSKGKNEELRIDVRNLDTNATYELTAQVGDDTNLTQVLEFTTDEHGNANIDFRSKNPGKGGGDGKNKHPIPAELEPITNIREITISDANTQAVLTANLTVPNKFEYLLKADLNASGVKGNVHINANNHKAQVRLDASGLTPGSDYSLSLNGSAVTTATTDAKGKLKIGWEAASPADILALETVALLDAGGIEVLSVTLP
jgi:hypothetical protein